MVTLAKYELARRTIRDVDESIYDGASLDDLVARLGPGCYINVVNGYYDESDDVRIVRDRKENDEEYNERIAELTAMKVKEAADARKRKVARDDQDRKTYERLKKKFEKASSK